MLRRSPLTAPHGGATSSLQVRNQPSLEQQWLVPLSTATVRRFLNELHKVHLLKRSETEPNVARYRQAEKFVHVAFQALFGKKHSALFRFEGCGEMQD